MNIRELELRISALDRDIDRIDIKVNNAIERMERIEEDVTRNKGNVDVDIFEIRHRLHALEGSHI